MTDRGRLATILCSTLVVAIGLSGLTIFARLNTSLDVVPFVRGSEFFPIWATVLLICVLSALAGAFFVNLRAPISRERLSFRPRRSVVLGSLFLHLFSPMVYGFWIPITFIFGWGHYIATALRGSFHVDLDFIIVSIISYALMYLLACCITAVGRRRRKRGVVYIVALLWVYAGVACVFGDTAGGM